MSIDEASPAVKTAIDALTIAKQIVRGGEVQVSVSRERSANTRFARNEVTSTGDVEETEVTVSVALGKSHAAASTNQTDAASLRKVAERALAMARVTPEDREHMPLVGKQTFVPVEAAHDAATVGVGAAARAAAIGTVVSQAEKASLMAAGFYEHGASESVIANSAGLFGWHHETNASMTVTARTADGTGSGWAGAESHRVADVDVPSIARIAVDKATRSAKPRPLDPGKYTVILEPAAVAELLSFYINALDARHADEGRSFFAKKGGGTKLGEKLFPESITLMSDPTNAATPGSPFDSEGIALRPTKWIDRGAIAALRYGRFWAAKQGKEPTGWHDVRQLLGGAAERPEDLLVGIKRGLLVTRFWYTRWLEAQSITITGLTRDGVFLIEDGQVTAPVQNFRFNESPVTMLANTDAMTKRTVRAPSRGGAWHVPTIRTHEFNMASSSAAV